LLALSYYISFQRDSKISSTHRLVGILLDNALETAEESTLKIVKFSVRVDEHGKLENIIMNSCDKDDVDVARIFERGYSTKSEPSGEGLYQARQIQEKYWKMGYALQIVPSCKEGFFTQVFKINLDKSGDTNVF